MPAEDGTAADAAGSAQRGKPPLPNAEEQLARASLDRKPVYDLDEDHRQRYNEAAVRKLEVYTAQASDDRQLRKRIAGRVFWAITAQVAIADIAFFLYGCTKHWNIPGSTMNAWLAATVVQVIAVGLVITRSLFPFTKTALQEPE
jgi:hypothetical protein